MAEAKHANLDINGIAKHIELYDSDPVAAHDFDTSNVGRMGIAPTLLLKVVGRKSGKSGAIPLIYQPVGDGFIVIGSLGGAPKHPEWYRNLVANPECDVQVGKFRYTAKAETVEGDLRERYWDLAARTWPSYVDYQVSAGDRRIPVVLLRTISVVQTD